MKRLILKSAVCCVGLVLVSGAALAQSGTCEGLQGATPGLYGLCIAFHNVEPCVPNPLMQDPFAGCEPKDGRLLEAYNNLKGPDDPRMPGTGGPCPCFTLEDMLDLAPDFARFYMCAIDTPNPSAPGNNFALWTSSILSYASYGDELDKQWGGQVNWAESTLPNTKAPPQGLCRYADPYKAPFVRSVYNLSEAEATACRDIIAATIGENVDQCDILCDPDCD